MSSIAEERFGLVTIGLDPHPGSLTVSAVSPHGRLLGERTLLNDSGAFRALWAWAQTFPERRWAVEGPGNRYVKQLVAELMKAGEEVYPIAPSLTAQYRSRRSRGKDDEIDAANAARALLANEDLPVHAPMSYEDDLKELTRSYHRLMSQLKATRMSAKEMASGVVRAALEAVIASLTEATRQLKLEMARLVRYLAPELLAKRGVGPVVAATVLAEAGRITRFPSEGHFASYAGAAPIVWESGSQSTVRVNPGGNRLLNHAAHIVAMSRLRLEARTRAYRDRKLAEGKTTREVFRLLKTAIAREFYRVLVHLSTDLELRAAELLP